MDDGLTNPTAIEAADLNELNPIQVFAPAGVRPWLSGAAAKFRGALHVNGSDTYGQLPSSASLDIGGDAVTVALWVKLEQLPANLSAGFGAIFDSTSDNYVIYLDRGNNELRFKVAASGGAQRPGIPAQDLVVGEWLHVAGVYDGAESRIYLNGDLKDTHAGPSGPVNPGQSAGIGRNGAVESNLFSGDVDELAIWNRALTVAEIGEFIGGGILAVFDADSDGLRDDWEMEYFSNLDALADGDDDGDLLTNDREFIAGSDPTESDTDGDGLDDFEEVVTWGSDPTSVDTDGDGLDDAFEVNISNTSPILADTDGDGLDDGEELNRAAPLNPLLADSDGDDVGDGEEVNVFLTDPLEVDSDGDSYSDSFEIRDSGSPLDGAVVPRMVRLGLEVGLVSLWTFDDKVQAGRSDRVQDALARNNLQLVSDDADAAWLDGLAAKNRGSLRVDGATTYVPVPNTPSLDGGTQKLTLAAWVNLDQLPSDIVGGTAGIFDAVEKAYVLYLDKGSNELRFGVSATGSDQPGIPAASLVTGEWLHVIGVYDGSAGTAKIYLNGLLMDTQNNASGPVSAGQVAAIGRNGVNTDGPFSGAVDDLALWNEVLTSAQIEVLFTGVPGVNGDVDGDGLPDEWETQYFGNLDQDGGDDPDMDSLTNLEEEAAGTSPILADSDEDGLDDGEEVNVWGSDPLSADSDNDLYADAFEVRDGGDPTDSGSIPRLATLGVADGLISFWTMNEAAGATKINDVMERNNLELSVNSPAGTRLVGIDAKFGNSIALNGFESYIDVPNTPSLNPGTAVTVAAWVRLNELPQSMPSGIGSIFDSVSDSYVLYLDKGNDELRFKVTATGAERPGIPASALSVGEWLHVAGVYDGVAGTSKIYLDGVLMDTHNNPTGTVTPGQFAAMGRNGVQENSFFNGALDDVGIWNVALNAAQLSRLFRNSPSDPNDSDGDQLPDSWEMENFGNLDRDGSGDFDNDGLTDAAEFAAGTSPLLADTDGDGASDAYEVARGTNPLDSESTPIPEGTGLAAGLIAYWPLDDGQANSSATNILDATGANHLVLAASNPTDVWLDSTASKFGGALLIDGLDSYVDVPASTSLDINGDAVTISTWVKLTALPSQQANAFAGIYDSVNDAYVLYLDRNAAELRFKVTANGAERPGIPETSLPLDEWIHIAGVYDGVAGEARIYLNGVLMDTHNGPTGDVSRGQAAAIGRNGTVEASFFDGAIDDLAIWNRALTPEEVSSLAAEVAILEFDFSITSIQYNPDGGAGGDGEFTLSWTSRPGRVYAVFQSPDLIDWEGEIDDSVPSQGETTTLTFDHPLPGASQLYFRVVRE